MTKRPEYIFAAHGASVLVYFAATTAIAVKYSRAFFPLTAILTTKSYV